MIISVITLGGMLLGSAGIAGLLMSYQIRSANDAVNSAKAFFAADAGVEASGYCLNKLATPTTPCDNSVLGPFVQSLTFSDSPNVYVTATSTVLSDGSRDVFSFGYAAGGKITRTLEAVFSPASP